MAEESAGERWSSRLRDRILIPAVVAIITSVITSVGIWWWQQSLLQQWGSQIVVEIRIAKDKELSIKNVGAVDIADVDVFFAQYIVGMEAREAGHLYTTGKIETVSQSFAPVKHWDRIAARHSELYSLRSNAAVFYPVASGHDLEAMRKQYAFRVGFRNSITKQKYVYYAITSAGEGPSFFDFSSGGAFGGPFDGSAKLIAIRRTIRSHQAELFDDSPQDLYH